MAFSTWNDGDGTWAVGTFSGESNDVSEEQTDHGGQAVTGRVTWLPYFDDKPKGCFRYMHFGACYSFRQVGDREVSFANFPGARPGAFDNIVWPRWVDTGPIDTENFQLFDVEWALVQGPLHIQAECAANLVNQFDGPNLTFWAWYVETGWFLTNDSRPYQREAAVFNRVFPTRPLMFPGMSKTNVQRGWGAWQVAFRADYLNLDSQNIQGGRLVDLTLSLNWYLNPYTRIYADYIHPFLTRDTPQGTTEANLFGLRAQFEF
jgi:phosphate-selective porin OprO/OprP